ncbi:MarR family transcriptional regulator [Cupriavidus consociatus]|uniref:MarR family transcriptional regulator n=1 Tax=Cupriavidus consociatus TaxID=2821357 RepID=UPI001AE9FF79|nr:MULTISPECIES: MarR family transcriptional regulator [unclassified Cupriavidus]MBP0620475.1 MarR family transcriptional regulator [Cupriavidus sp. LEh25]MDK2657133.1 MarR family transcriptional regulator [Cupriavidus sp. LEh21]
MQPRPLEPNEPVVLALVDAVTAWQDALEQTLSASGLNYAKWLLLRAIRRGDFVRGTPLPGPMLIDVSQSELLLHELRRDGWIEHAEANAPRMPRIADTAASRLERVSQALSALHSVSVAPFSPQERVALGSLLERMKIRLNDHTTRQIRVGGEAARQDKLAGGAATQAGTPASAVPCTGLPPVAHRPASCPTLASARF